MVDQSMTCSKTSNWTQAGWLCRRGYDRTMAEVMQPITDTQILNLAYYIAWVR